MIQVLNKCNCISIKSLRLFPLQIAIFYLLSFLSVGLVHEIGNLIGGWEALVDELEVVIVESLVVFKVVLLALKEPVDLCEP